MPPRRHKYPVSLACSRDLRKFQRRLSNRGFPTNFVQSHVQATTRRASRVRKPSLLFKLRCHPAVEAGKLRRSLNAFPGLQASVCGNAVRAAIAWSVAPSNFLRSYGATWRRCNSFGSVVDGGGAGVFSGVILLTCSCIDSFP